jgi:GTP pyrophosphokinase
VSVALADAGVNVLSAAISTDRQGIAYMRFLFELGNMDQLQKVLSTVRGVNGVFDARRTMPEGGRKRGGAS